MATFRENRAHLRPDQGPARITPHQPQMIPTTGPRTNIYPGLANPAESANARRGQAEATKGFQDLGSFTPTDGLHSVGADHIAEFSQAIRMSGGVRQGAAFVSDPARGVARASVDGFHQNFEQTGDTPRVGGATFEERQHSRWAGHGG